MLIIAGGGSGGHVLPAISIAQEWVRRGGTVLFIGAYGGMEEKLVPQAGYPLILFKIGSLKNVPLGKKLYTLLQLPVSFIRSLQILLHERPTAVVGVGGYASGAFVLLSSVLSPFLKIKTAIIEPNAVVGFTNRILGKFVDRIFCTFREASRFFNEDRCRYPGSPIRSVMKRCPPSQDTRPYTLFIFGGSQGAVGMNTLVLSALPEILQEFPDLKIIHQSGRLDDDRVKKMHKDVDSGARVEIFIDDMLSCYEKARLIISRAGASTLSELAAVGRAAVLVPLPTAADNHQEVNARIYEKAGAVKVISQISTSPHDFAKTVIDLLKSPDKISTMEKVVTDFYRPNAVHQIADEILK